MALALVVAFDGFVLTVGDGASPEVFTAPCAFSSRALNLTKNLNEIILPDCDEEAKAGWIVRDPLSMSWDVTGEGILDEGSIDIWDEWFLESTSSRHIQITITTDTGDLVYLGRAHLQTWNRTAEAHNFLRYNVAIAGSGPLTRTPAPAGTVGSSFMDSAAETEAFMDRRERSRARRAEAKPAPAKARASKAREPA